MIKNINPNSFTDISTGSCTISSGGRNTELVRIYEGNKFIVESYLNTPITILTNTGLKAKTLSRDISITIDLAGELVTSKLFSNGLALKEIINSDSTTPNISNIIDYILAGRGTEAVNKVVLDIDAQAIDWVLDPANNRVKYTVAGVPADPSTGNGYYWYDQHDSIKHESLMAAMVYSCRVAQESVYKSHKFNPAKTTAVVTCVQAAYGTAGGTVSRGDPIPTSGAGGSNEKYIPIDTVAAKVIANAEAGHAPSQEAVNNSV